MQIELTQIEAGVVLNCLNGARNVVVERLEVLRRQGQIGTRVSESAYDTVLEVASELRLISQVIIKIAPALPEGRYKQDLQELAIQNKQCTEELFDSLGIEMKVELVDPAALN